MKKIDTTFKAAQAAPVPQAPNPAAPNAAAGGTVRQQASLPQDNSTQSQLMRAIQMLGQINFNMIEDPSVLDRVAAQLDQMSGKAKLLSQRKKATDRLLSKTQTPTPTGQPLM